MGLFTTKQIPVTPLSINNLSQKQKYEKLEAYYNNNDLYDDLTRLAYQNSYYMEVMKPLRNPCHSSVEFYAAKIFGSEAVQINTKNQQVKDTLELVHKWSNMQSIKTIASRNLALYGDIFIRVAKKGNKVYQELINPKLVTDFTTDNRGNLLTIRIDQKLKDDLGQTYWYTEYWEKGDNGYYAIWEHRLGENANLEQLPEPIESGYLSEFGIDFIPIVHASFTATDNTRGKSSFFHALSKIDESNRQASRLHQMLFRNNKPLWVSTSSNVDKDGKFKAPPLTSGQKIDATDNSILSMPNMTDIKSLVPDVKYADALAIVQAQVEEVEKDLPEIRYFALKDNGLSGKALRTLLGSAVDRANEARSGLVSAFIRADEIALTIGMAAGIFSGLGSYENGDFDHSYILPDIFPVNLDDIALTLQSLKNAGLPLSSALKMIGKDDEFIAEVEAQLQADLQRNQDSLGVAMQRFNYGG